MDTPLYDAIRRWQRASPKTCDEDYALITRELRLKAWLAKQEYPKVNWIDIDDLAAQGWAKLVDGSIINIIDRDSLNGSKPLTDAHVRAIFFNQIRSSAEDCGARKGRKRKSPPNADSNDEGLPKGVVGNFGAEDSDWRNVEQLEDETFGSPLIAGAAHVALSNLVAKCERLSLPFRILKLWIAVALSPPEHDQKGGRHIARFQAAAELTRNDAEQFDARCRKLVGDEIAQFQSVHSTKVADVVDFVRRLVSDC